LSAKLVHHQQAGGCHEQAKDSVVADVEKAMKPVLTLISLGISFHFLGDHLYS